MRNISPTSLNKIMTRLGTEPINVVAIQWNITGKFHYYSDKQFSITEQEANIANSETTIIEGKIEELSNLENVVKLSDNARSQNITVKLNDTDGSLKTIIDNNDIHKRIVYVYQWFYDIPFTEAFIIFEGRINSPIIWKEGERTLTFDVVEQLEDNEVGFSPEEGQFDIVPYDMVGKAWPLGFGTNQFVPATKINEVPAGIITGALGVGDPSLRLQMGKNTAKANSLEELQRLYLLYALSEAGIVTQLDIYIANLESVISGAANATAAFSFSGSGTINTTGITSVTTTFDAIGSADLGISSTSNYTSITGLEGTTTAPVTDVKAAESALSQAQSQRSQAYSQQLQFENQAAQFGAERGKILNDNAALNAQQLLQESFYHTVGVITETGTPFPLGPARVKIGQVEVDGFFSGYGSTLTFTPSGNAINPNDNREFINSKYPATNPIQASPNDNSKVVQKTTFYVAQPGTSIRLISFFPIYYIANIIPSQIWSVWAHRKVGSATVLVGVPSSLYTIVTKDFGTVVEQDGIIKQGLRCTTLIFPRALTTYDEGWEDDVFVTMTSPIGPNTVDIISYVLATYTSFTLDPVSSNFCRNLVNQYPSNFVLLERKNIVQFLEEVCFQAKLFVYIASGIVYLKYIPYPYSPVDTINEQDIEFNTLEIESTRTEDVVTKAIAKWKPNYLPKKENEIVVRNNIYKYGLHEKTYDFYIYNIQAIVETNLTFWIIRKSNTFKIIKFKTPLHKLNLEAYDYITLNFDHPFIASGPVTGIVLSNKYDSLNNTLEFEVWTPVRIGELVAYPLAIPYNLPLNEIFPAYKDIIDYIGAEPINPNPSVGGHLGTAVGGGVSVANSPLFPNNLKLNKNNSISGTAGVANLSDNFQGGKMIIDNIQLGISDSGGNIVNHNGADLSPYIGQPVIAIPPSNNVLGGFSASLIGQLTNVIGLGSSSILEGISNIPAGWQVFANLFGQTLDNNLVYNQDYDYFDYPFPTTDRIPEQPSIGGGGGGGGIPGIIVSGSGDSYQVEIFPDGLSGTSTVVTVKQLQIDSLATIPPGDSVMVNKVKDGYYMQFPVWG